MRFPPQRNVADIKNYPSFNLRKAGVQVEVLEWLGDIAKYDELQETWVEMRGIPPNGATGLSLLRFHQALG